MAVSVVAVETARQLLLKLPLLGDAAELDGAQGPEEVSSMNLVAGQALVPWWNVGAPAVCCLVRFCSAGHWAYYSDATHHRPYQEWVALDHCYHGALYSGDLDLEH
jgi:hypothetical protein